MPLLELVTKESEIEDWLKLCQVDPFADCYYKQEGGPSLYLKPRALEVAWASPEQLEAIAQAVANAYDVKPWIVRGVSESDRDVIRW